MKKFRVQVLFSGTETYVIEAKNEYEAKEKVLSGGYDPIEDEQDLSFEGIESVEEIIS